MSASVCYHVSQGTNDSIKFTNGKALLRSQCLSASIAQAMQEVLRRKRIEPRKMKNTELESVTCLVQAPKLVVWGEEMRG